VISSWHIKSMVTK